MSERSKEMREQKQNKGSVLVAESAYISQKAQFGLVMNFVWLLNFEWAKSHRIE